LSLDVKDTGLAVAFASTENLTPKLLATVPAHERRRADEFRSAKRRTEFLLGRALLYMLLGRALQKNRDAVEIVIDESGKPHCSGGPHINISHSDGVVACAISTRGEIGIDLEEPRSGRNTAGIAERFFTPEEVEWLSHNDDGFFMLWVLKEAWLKATGKGLPGGLHSLSCRVDGELIDARVDTGAPPILSLYAVDDALFAIATFGDTHDDVRFLRWDAAAGELVDGHDVHRIAATTGDG
jgi:phosphopantetheine--protein transferase-like protein